MANREDSMSDSDAELRILLAKKLKLVLDKKSEARNGSSSAETRRSLARYSSGEDSDLDADTGGAKPPPPQAARTRRPTPKKDSPVKKVTEEERGSESEKESRGPMQEVETVTTRQVTRMFKPTVEYETGSDSDVDVDKKTSPFRSDSRSSDTLPIDSTHVRPPKPYSCLSMSAAHPIMGSAQKRLGSIRSRLGLTSGFTDHPSLSSRPRNVYISSYKSSGGADHSVEVESPHLNNFAKPCVSTFTSEPIRAAPVEHDGGGTAYEREPYVTSALPSQSDYRTGNMKILGSYVGWLAVVAMLAVYYYFLYIMFVVSKHDMEAVLKTPICQRNFLGDRPGINCVHMKQVALAKSLLERLRPELIKRAAAFKCGELNASPFLTESEIILMGSNSPEKIRLNLYNLHVLLVSNPQWGVSVVEMKSPSPEHTSLKKIDEIAVYRPKGNVALMITDPSTPIYCRLTNILYSATIILLAAVVAVGYFGYRVWKMYIAYKKRMNKEMYSMVDQIINVIYQECKDSEDPYISVNRVRDMLIAPPAPNRVKMASVWECAIAFIKKNESRVRMKVQSVDGEDCQVWRWVSTCGGSPRASAPAWQGQAFETQEGSVNDLSVSPTPCLKIRHMFDKNENNLELRSVSQDAIVEKVGDECNIVHIDLDSATCYVYVKCASPKDAYVVYKSLHDWWYNGKTS